MNILFVANKLVDTYLKIYTREEGLFKSVKYYAELCKEGSLSRKYKIESKFIAQFVSTYEGLFAIANRPWPRFDESEIRTLLEFVDSGFLSKMIEQFDGGEMLKYNEEYNRISVIAGINEFNLQLDGDKGTYIYKADESWKRIDPDYYNFNDCICHLNKSQIELFLATISYKFNDGLIPGMIRDIFHITSHLIGLMNRLYVILPNG